VFSKVFLFCVTLATNPIRVAHQ